MIQLQISEEKFEYDIRGLLMAFYPQEEIEKIPWAEAETAAAPWRRRLRVWYGTNEIKLTLHKAEPGVSLPLSDIPAAAGELSYACLTETAAVALADRSQTKCALKRALYRLLWQDTQKTLPWGTLTGIRPTKIAMGLLEAGQSEEAIAAYMKREYLASDEKTALSVEIARRERELLKKIDYEDGYSLYIGIPFCPTTCLYCSFTSYPFDRFAARADEYIEALERELAWTARAFKGKKLGTVYFGGGTPTTLSAAQLDRLLAFVETQFDGTWLQEFTVEAGRPDSITEEKLKALRSHAVSRISINPQTMNQRTLDVIGRRHSVEQICRAFWLARELGFDNINMDLILGLPGEGLDDVRRTMEEIKKLRPDSITVHSLAVKRAARLNQLWEQYAHMTMENSDEAMAAAARASRELGLQPYYLYRQKNMAGNLENVGFAAPGKEGLYNILIMEEKQTIVACGAGSISKRVYPDGRIERCENVKDVALYMEKVDGMIERKKRLLGEG